jgi:CRISPR-associated protein Cas2
MTQLKHMRVILFFDLPTVTKKEKKLATKFRQTLLNSSFIMLQWSIYTRYCKNNAGAEQVIESLNHVLPPMGNIRVLKVTEKQFDNIILLLGKKKKQEEIMGDQLILF